MNATDRHPLLRALRACALFVALATGLLLIPRADAPASEGDWSRWQNHAAGSTDTIDHAYWFEITINKVAVGADGQARVAYSLMHDYERELLDRYMAQMGSIPLERFDRPEQLAFWVNVYNALHVKIVLEHYPVRSIRDINLTPDKPTAGPWDKPLFAIGDQTLSLNDIERRIVRPIWHDPRIHYVLNCASIGCANLSPLAYGGEDIESRLDEAARTYINHPRGARIEGNKLIVSSIYEWFRDDFGGSDAAVIAHLRRYAEGDLAAGLASRTSIDRYEYDWSLNELVLTRK